MKKNEKLLNSIGKIDDGLISDAVNDTNAKKKSLWIKCGALVATLVLCVGIGIGVFSFMNRNGSAAGNSVIMLDVNPSISLTVNKKEKIVTAAGLNEDGKAVLNGMDLQGVDMNVAVNAIVGSMMQKGYLSDMQNAILVSVENSDTAKSAELQKRISDMIGTALQNVKLDGAVLSQSLKDTSALEQMAKDYNISVGKAALIKEVIAKDSTLTAEKLAPLSITEITLISESKHLSSDSVSQNGTASDKAYISKEDALEIAYKHAGVKASDATGVKIEFDIDDTIFEYEIDFRVGTVEYEYGINAQTGKILEYEKKDKSVSRPESKPEGTTENKPVNPPSTQPSSKYIGVEAAKKAALSNAKVSANDVKYINAQIEYDDGRAEYYEVEFTVGKVHYEYEIDLYSGKVLDVSVKNYGNYNTEKPPVEGTTASGTKNIGEKAAKAAALSHAGLTESQVKLLKAEYDIDDGVAVYEVDFIYNNYEYDYKINAATGAVIEHEKEKYGF